MNKYLAKILCLSTLFFGIGCNDKSKTQNLEQNRFSNISDKIAKDSSLSFKENKIKSNEELNLDEEIVKNDNSINIKTPIILEKELDGFFLGYKNNSVVFKGFSKGNFIYTLDETNFSLKLFKKLDDGFISFFINDIGIVGSFNNKIRVYYFDGNIKDIDIGFKLNNISSNNDISNFFFNKESSPSELYSMKITDEKPKKMNQNGSTPFMIKGKFFFTNSSSENDVYNVDLDLYKGKINDVKKNVSKFFQDGWSFSDDGKHFLHSKNIEGDYTTRVIDLETRKIIFELGNKSEYFSYYSKTKNTFVLHK